MKLQGKGGIIPFFEISQEQDVPVVETYQTNFLDILHQSINLAQICKVLGQWMRTWSADSSKTKQKGQLASLASRIPLQTKTPLVLILPKIAIQQKIAILRGTSPFYILLKELHTLDCVEVDNIPHIDLTDLGFQISL